MTENLNKPKLDAGYYYYYNYYARVCVCECIVVTSAVKRMKYEPFLLLHITEAATCDMCVCGNR